MRKSRWILGFVFVLLAGALVLQILKPAPPSRPVNASRQSGRLDRFVPAQLDGWTVKNEPLGPSEFLQARAEEVLNYDDYAYRTYVKLGASFSLYVAYWAPGRMPTRLISNHTPDRCWTENGWTCTDSVFGKVLPVGDHSLLPAQWRTFTPPGSDQKTYVLFWLLVSGQNHDFGHRIHNYPSPTRWIGQFIGEFFKGYQEHYFVRLTSDRPFEEIWKDVEFQRLLGELAAVGLIAPEVHTP